MNKDQMAALTAKHRAALKALTAKLAEEKGMNYMLAASAMAEGVALTRLVGELVPEEVAGPIMSKMGDTFSLMLAVATKIAGFKAREVCDDADKILRLAEDGAAELGRLADSEADAEAVERNVEAGAAAEETAKVIDLAKRRDLH